MPKLLLLEEFHLSLRVPAGMADAECDIVRRVISSRAFRQRLLKALKRQVERHPALSNIRVAVTR